MLQELANGSKAIKAKSRPIEDYAASQECLLHNSIQPHSLIRGEFILEVELLLRHL